MTKLSKFKKTSDVTETKESVGGGYYVPESGVYQYTVTKAYLDESAKGSMFLGLELTSAEHTFNHSLYFTTNKQNGQEVFYKTKDGKKKYLPSFLLVDSLCQLLTEKDFGDQDVEEKLIKLYDKAAGKEVGKKREVLVDLLGKDILVGVIKSLEDSYRDPSKEVTRLSIDKFFDVDSKLTAQEIENDMEKPDFYEKWIDKNKGVTKDERELSLPSASVNATEAALPVDDDSPFSDDESVDAEPVAAVEEEEEDLFN